MSPVRAAVCSVGDELLVGEVLDTNGAWLAEHLTGLGLDVATQVVVGDDEDALAAEVGRLAAAHRVVVCGGGLGPTSDDRTRAAVARAAGVALERREELVAAVRARYGSSRLPESNLAQAEVPAGARALDPVGTAPGFVLQVGDASVVALPGVPWELRALFDRDVAPALAELPGRRPRVTRRVLVTGRGESAVADRLRQVEADLGGDVDVGYLAGRGRVIVKVAAADADPATAARQAQAALDRVTGALGEWVSGVDVDDVAALAVDALAERGARVAVAESATAGLVAARLAGIPGASQVLAGGVVVYDEAAKVELAGVDPELLARHGPVSREVTGALAEGIRRRLGVDVGLATTGAAGPEPHGGREVGTVVWALADDERVQVDERVLRGDRDAVRERLAGAALDALWRWADR